MAGRIIGDVYTVDTVTGCPWKEVLPSTHALFELYTAYEAGLWYEDGAWLDQPAWYTEAMGTIKGALNSIQAKEMKDRQHA